LIAMIAKPFLRYNLTIAGTVPQQIASHGDITSIVLLKRLYKVECPGYCPI